MNRRSSKMRMVEAPSEIGVERDRLDPGCLLFRPDQNPRPDQPSIDCASYSRLGELPSVEQQARVHFGENLAGDGSQQLHGLLEMGFLVLSTGGAAMCTIPKIFKMADQTGDICGHRACWHCLPPTKSEYVLHIYKHVSIGRDGYSTQS